MPTRRTPGRCSCGATYPELRTGMTFGEVRRMMWVASEEATLWRSKSRRAVLGFWRQLKLALWDSIHGHCA